MCALWRGTALISQIIGNLGEVDFMRWRNKLVVRQTPKIITDPNSPKQQIIRNAVAFASNRWRNVLTPAQRAQWNNHAQVHRSRYAQPAGIYRIPQGNNGNFSGINAYIIVNVKLASIGQPPTDIPPDVASKPITIGGFAAIWNPILFSIDCNWTTSVPLGANDSVRLWIDHHQEQFHRQIAITVSGPGLVASIVSVTGAGGAVIPLTTWPNTVCIVQGDIVTSIGGASAPGEAIDVTI